MISEYNEIEAKLDAGNVLSKEFRVWVNQFDVERYECVTGPDHYYETSGGEVVRVRVDTKSETCEITVKKRTNSNSTRDRLEVDLKLGPTMTAKDAHAFLTGIGFTKVFTLVKTAHIFWVRFSPNLTGTLVIYDVWLELKGEEAPMTRRRYIEVEAEKKSEVTPETGKRHVRAWVQKLQEQFKLGEPLNDSLYEIYSNKKYLSV
jgi:adenylate cyclase class IV